MRVHLVGQQVSAFRNTYLGTCTPSNLLQLIIKNSSLTLQQVVVHPLRDGGAAAHLRRRSPLLLLLRLLRHRQEQEEEEGPGRD